MLCMCVLYACLHVVVVVTYCVVWLVVCDGCVFIGVKQVRLCYDACGCVGCSVVDVH